MVVTSDIPHPTQFDTNRPLSDPGSRLFGRDEAFPRPRRGLT